MAAAKKPEVKADSAKQKNFSLYLRMLVFALITLLLIFSIYVVRLVLTESADMNVIAGIIAVLIVPLVFLTAFFLNSLLNYGRMKKG